MWWFRFPAAVRVTGLACLVAGVCLLTGACGFQPLYYKDGQRMSIRGEMESIYVRPIPDRLGQQLRNSLQDGLAPAASHAKVRWTLSVALSENIQEISLQSTNFSTRVNLTVTAAIQLTPKALDSESGQTGKTLTASFNTISSYNLVDSPYANLIAERNARSQAAEGLSSDIRRQLALWLRQEQG